MGVTYYCNYCNYETDHKAKHNRHVTTLKHMISEYGIVCCGLNYYDKHKWVNHKKSVKHHQMFQGDDDSDPYKLLNLPSEKMDITLSMKEDTTTSEATTTSETKN